MGVLDKPLTPCQGICTATVFGDLVCRGCGRTLAEVNDWNKYTDELKIKIMKRCEDNDYGRKKINYIRPK